MIDHFCIMTYGGVVLWAWTNAGANIVANNNPIDSLIGNVLIEDRSNKEREHIVNEWKLKWLFSVEAQLVFIVVFQRFLQFVHIDRFLGEVRDAFEVHTAKLCPRARGNARGASAAYACVDFSNVFDDDFKRLVARFDALEQYSQAPAAAATIRGDAQEEEENHDGAAVTNKDHHQEESSDPDAPPSPATGTLPPNQTKNNKSNQDTSSSSTPALVTASGKKLVAGGRGRGGGGGGPGSSPVNNKGDADGASGPKGGKGAKRTKEARTWNQDGSAATASQAAARAAEQADLEARSSGSSAAQLDQAAANAREKYIKIDPKTGKEATMKADDWSDQVKERGQFSNWFRGFFGGVELDMQDLDKILPKLKEKLVSKNVAMDVADKVIESLKATLAGKKIASFESMEKVVELALIDSLRRILRPKREINILREIEDAKARNRPYTIVFCGVNGVGKSTSLSKVAFWLQQNGHSILIAAGDTFRNGAVEQLQVHGRCLDIPIYQMGYGTDPTMVTKQAMQYAVKNKIDVVLVDTAGRMQDHESRMAALARLIGDNAPDLTLFVGEALVGNTGIDQLRKFNQCLVDYAKLGVDTRGIDGIFLTKFDTIDDKVGAAISMVYQLGQPIVFVGVGQTYQDLKTVEPEAIVECLMR